LHTEVATVLLPQLGGREARHQRNLTKYAPDAAGAIYTVLAAMAGSSPKGPKRRRQQEASSLLHQVARKEVRDLGKLLSGACGCADWCMLAAGCSSAVVERV
jgi:hypothetical protein